MSEINSTPQSGMVINRYENIRENIKDMYHSLNEARSLTWYHEVEDKSIPDNVMEEVRNQLHLIDNGVHRIQNIIIPNEILGECIINIHYSIHQIRTVQNDGIGYQLDSIERLIDSL
jgi:hypothetical protein